MTRPSSPYLYLQSTKSSAVLLSLSQSFHRCQDHNVTMLRPLETTRCTTSVGMSVSSLHQFRSQVRMCPLLLRFLLLWNDCKISSYRVGCPGVHGEPRGSVMSCLHGEVETVDCAQFEGLIKQDMFLLERFNIFLCCGFLALSDTSVLLPKTPWDSGYWIF